MTPDTNATSAPRTRGRAILRARRSSLPELLIVLLIAGIAAAGGVWLGIVVLAPRLTRIIDRTAADEPSEPLEDHGDRHD